MHPNDPDYDEPELDCPDCGNPTDNTAYDSDGETWELVGATCDDCTLYPCEHCGEEVKARDLSEWCAPSGRLPSQELCWDCYKAVEPSPAEDGRW